MAFLAHGRVSLGNPDLSASQEKAPLEELGRPKPFPPTASSPIDEHGLEALSKHIRERPQASEPVSKSFIPDSKGVLSADGVLRISSSAGHYELKGFPPALGECSCRVSERGICLVFKREGERSIQWTERLPERN